MVFRRCEIESANRSVCAFVSDSNRPKRRRRRRVCLAACRKTRASRTILASRTKTNKSKENGRRRRRLNHPRLQRRRNWAPSTGVRTIAGSLACSLVGRLDSTSRGQLEWAARLAWRRNQVTSYQQRRIFAPILIFKQKNVLKQKQKQKRNFF